MEDKGKKSLWGFVDGIRGDKVILVIVICLILISIVALFSSTSISPEVMQGKISRTKLFTEQLFGVAMAVAVLFACYIVPSVKFYMVLSQFGFLLSLMLYLIMYSGITIPHVIRPLYSNGLLRGLMVLKFSVNVVEVAKVSMVLYLAWAVDAWKNGRYGFANKFSEMEHFGWLANPFWQGVIYILLPIVVISLLTQPSGTSNTLFLGGVMFATILIGGFSYKDTLIYVLVGATILSGGYFLYKKSDGNLFARLYDRFETTGTSRIGRFINSSDSIIVAKLKASSGDEYYAIKSEYDQTVGAKIAIHQGGLFGKGPGNSTQKYVVPLAFSDFMFAFLIEEYGLLLGGVFIIFLYVSLLARGSLIARNCKNLYARTAVGGLTVLITGQAFMHMLINVGMVPVTGQTLPMISDGKSSLLMFSMAFGILLSFSKMVKEKIERYDEAARKWEPDTVEENVDYTMDELDQFESYDDGQEYEE